MGPPNQGEWHLSGLRRSISALVMIRKRGLLSPQQLKSERCSNIDALSQMQSFAPLPHRCTAEVACYSSCQRTCRTLFFLKAALMPSAGAHFRIFVELQAQ